MVGIDGSVDGLSFRQHKIHPKPKMIRCNNWKVKARTVVPKISSIIGAIDTTPRTASSPAATVKWHNGQEWIADLLISFTSLAKNLNKRVMSSSRIRFSIITQRNVFASFVFDEYSIKSRLCRILSFMKASVVRFSLHVRYFVFGRGTLVFPEKLKTNVEIQKSLSTNLITIES